MTRADSSAGVGHLPRGGRMGPTSGQLPGEASMDGGRVHTAPAAVHVGLSALAVGHFLIISQGNPGMPQKLLQARAGFGVNLRFGYQSPTNTPAESTHKMSAVATTVCEGNHQSGQLHTGPSLNPVVPQ